MLNILEDAKENELRDAKENELSTDNCENKKLKVDRNNYTFFGSFDSTNASDCGNPKNIPNNLYSNDIKLKLDRSEL